MIHLVDNYLIFKGARVLKESLESLDTAHPRVLLRQLGVLAEKMGGSSGGVYSLLFTGAANAFMVSFDVFFLIIL